MLASTGTPPPALCWPSPCVAVMLVPCGDSGARCVCFTGTFELFKSVKKCKATVPPTLRPPIVGGLTAGEAWEDPNFLDAVSVMEGLEMIRRDDGLDPDQDPESEGDAGLSDGADVA